MENITLLIIEDEEQMRMVLRYIIENSEFSYFDLREAATAEEAMNIISKEKIDIIICDYLLDKMGGIDFCKRASSLLPWSIRILISGNINFDELRSAMGRGDVFKFISKPFNEDEIINVLKEAMERIEENKKRKDLLDRLKDF